MGAAEDDLVCDFAEHYKILDIRQLPVELAATLAAGLPDTSRVMRKVTSNPVTYDRIMLAALYDAVRVLIWLQSKDGANGRNRPKSVLASLIGADSVNDIQGFDTPEDFEAARAAILERHGHRNS